MSVPVSQQIEAEVERQVAERTAHLTELLGHLLIGSDHERRLLARKLHDSLGSSMTALTMHLALLTQQLPREKVVLDRSAQMKQLLLNIINTNRDMQLSLWNDKLEFLGVRAAISELVAEFGIDNALLARISLPDEDGSYPREHAVALLRCVEEGLRNVLAHAGASEVDVILDDNEDELMVTVRDNGVGPGLDEPWQRTSCHALRLLRERARHHGGTLTLTAATGGGTILTMILPKQP